MFRSHFNLPPVQYSTAQTIKVRRSLLKQKTNEFSKFARTSKHFQKRVNYLDLSSHFSKAIDIKRYEKKGRPKKALKSKTSLKKEKHARKRREVYCQTESRSNNKEVVIESEFTQEHDIQATTTVTILDKEEWEKRKSSIKAKLLLRKEHLLTKDEEQDIHMRADVYAITTMPDSSFFVLPEYDSMPREPVRVEEITIDTTYPAVRKKRRKNYGDATCYINEHNSEDIFDNTKMLPLGTRLMKPPNKLVELVAQAVDGSPDGLLQVQQIYTYLQNRYPYFRYMERGAVNSWRSSIRHALYQKWFRKIRFDLNYISCKGCYWAINHKSSPKEWTMPPDNCAITGSEEQLLLDSFAVQENIQKKLGTFLQDEQMTEENVALLSASQDYGSQINDNTCLSQNSSIDIDVENHIPSPVKEPDPILATCAPDWLTDEFFYMHQQDSNNIDTLDVENSSNTLLSPSLSSPIYSSTDSHDEIGGAELQLGTPITSPVQQNLNIFTSTSNSLNTSKNSIIINKRNPENEANLEENILCDNKCSSDCTVSSSAVWKPCEEDNGTAIVSSSQQAAKMYMFGCPLKLQNQNLINGLIDDIDLFESECSDYNEPSEFYSTFNNINGIYKNIETCSSDLSGSEGNLSDFDIIAEFSKSSGPSSPSDN